jgi:hypothetical protein
MALTTRTELLAAIADWLNRADLTAQIPDFVKLCEAKLRRRLQRETVVDSETITTSPFTLPVACAELRSIRLDTGEPYRDKPLVSGTLEMLAELNARHSGVAGRPTHYAVVGRDLYLAPEPAASYTAILSYYTNFSSIADGATTNSILTEAPDLYLNGSCAAAERFLKNDPRVDLWKSDFETGIEELNEKRSREEYGGSLRPARLPVVF